MLIQENKSETILKIGRKRQVTVQQSGRLVFVELNLFYVLEIVSR